MTKAFKFFFVVLILIFMTGCDMFRLGEKEEEKFVTFSYNDSVYSDYKCKIKDSKINCMVIEPSNNELAFMGWYDENDNPVDITGEFTEAVTLHPKFLTDDEAQKVKQNEKKYTITFNMNGGNGSVKSIDAEYEGQLFKLENIPTRSGYHFLGFYDNKDYSKGTQYYSDNGEAIRNFDKARNTTLYAGWIKEVKPTQSSSFQPVPSKSSSSLVKPSSSSIRPSSSIQKPSSSSIKPSSSSIKPSSSSIRPSSSTQKPSSSSIKPSSSSIKPSSSSIRPSSSTQPIIKYTVSFNLNNGSGSVPGNVTVEYGKAMPGISTSKPTRTGYTFMGWYDSSDYTKGTEYYTSENKSARNYNKTSNITLYAGWKANTFTVKYNGNGNTGGSTSNHTCTYDSDCKLRENGYTKTGYIFAGWKKSNAGNIVAATSSIKNIVASGEVTYYAQWTAATYTVSFSANGGSGGQTAAVKATYGKAMPGISTSKPTRDGYTFMGWYDNSNYANGTQYYRVDGTSVRNYDKYADATLYAGWKVNTYTVSFNLNGGTGSTPGNVKKYLLLLYPRVVMNLKVGMIMQIGL